MHVTFKTVKRFPIGYMSSPRRMLGYISVSIETPAKAAESIFFFKIPTKKHHLVPTLIHGGSQSCSFLCLLLWCLNAAHRLLSSVCVTPRPTEKLHFRPELFKVDPQDFRTSSLSDALWFLPTPCRPTGSQTADKHERRNRMCRAALVVLTEPAMTKNTKQNKQIAKPFS